MNTSITEIDLVRKLVTEWHLSVPERRQLSGGKVRGAAVCAAIEERLRADGWFPATWRPNQPFSGGLIEYRPDGACQIYWQSEVGVQRFQLDEIQKCGSPAEASMAYARRFFGDNIDGVPIDWNA